MNIFDLSDYKEVIRRSIQKNTHQRGYQTLLAKAAGCSRSFLSQVIGRYSEIDLTRDQAIGLCNLWAFSEIEIDYFLTLVDLKRSKTKYLRDYLEGRLKKIKDDQAKLSKKLNAENINNINSELVYYSSWIFAAVHILITIPDYRDSKSISSKLKLPENLVIKTLHQLSELGLIEKNENVWVPTQKNINLNESSPLSIINHCHWRYKAITSVQQRNLDSLHYSSVFTISQNDLNSLRQLIKDFIFKSRELIVKSPEEVIYCFNLDFFEL